MSGDVEAMLFSSRPETVKEGRYVLQGRIGAGGVAEVYRALDTKYDSTCAVKLLEIPKGARKPVGVRFLGEAKVMSKLRHPNVPRVYDAGKEGEYYWFAMDLAEGSVAQQVHQHGPYSPFDALRLTFDVLQALAAVHQMGLIHRDVKPENVLLAADDGRALLADFGIARHPEGSVPVMTRPGELMGTRGYRAPEQEDDAHEVLPSADLYGVAATLYTMVVGKPPGRLWRKEGGSAIPEHIDAAVAAVIRGGASEDPDERFADARAMALKVAESADTHRPRSQEPVAEAWMARFDELLQPPEDATGRPSGWRALLPGWASKLLG